MLKYAICEISGKQYRLIPGQPLEVELNGELSKTFDVPVLVLADEGKIKIGKPYLKNKLTLKCLEVLKGKKIRVAKYHAKANWRKVRGFRPRFTKVVWAVKNPS